MAANNSFASATQVARAYSSLSGLRINSPGEEAYYKIHLERNASFRDSVTLNFTHSAGDLRLDLYSLSGELLQSSDSSFSEETVYVSNSRNYELLYLDGYKPGDYYIKVSGVGGAVNNYSLDFILPASLKADKFEINDTAATATSLPGASGKWENLTIHTDNDVDYYKIHLNRYGDENDYVKISPTDTGNGFLYLDLYDADGNKLNAFFSNDRLDLYQEAGDYYIKVYGSEPGGYELSWNLPSSLTPRPDAHEGDDTRAAATALTGRAGEIKHLTHHTKTDADWFKFTLDRSGKTSDTISATANRDKVPSLRLYDSKGQSPEKRRRRRIDHPQSLRSQGRDVLCKGL